MAEKITISRISHFDKDKNGNPLTSKTGKPYTRCLIDLTDGRKVSGFGNATTKKWSAGDEVEIEITQSGEYWNFSVPKVEQGGMSSEDRERLSRIEKYVYNINEHVMRMYKASGIEKDNYPEYNGAPDFDNREAPLPDDNY